MKFKLKFEEVVRSNIDHFKSLVKDMLNHAHKMQHEHMLEIAALVNRHTGDVRFPELSHDPHLKKADWKAIQLSIHKKDPSKAAVLTIKKGTKEVDDLTDAAKDRFKETIDTLNFFLSKYPKIETLNKVLKALSSEKIDKIESIYNHKDIIHEAWHQADRFQVETLLEGKAQGTFCFRKDYFAEVLEKELQMQWSKNLKCLTLSFIDKGLDVKDITLVLFQGAWQLYDNDPELRGAKYTTILELLQTLSDKAYIPLLHL